MRSIRLVAALLWLLPALAPATPLYRKAPVPAWVVATAVDAARPVAGDGDSSYLLRSDQISLMGRQPEHYRRRVVRLLQAGAIDDWSTLNVSVDPGYQRLLIHHVRVYRDGHWHDRLGSARVRELQRGDGMDDGLVDDTRTVSLVLDDVRVGDVLDFDYTIVGANPVFGGRFVSRIGVASSVPVRQRLIRLLYPASQPLHTRVRGPTLRHVRRVQGGRVDERWQGTDLPAYHDDAHSPSWYVPSGWMDVSGFADWRAVQRWAQPLYRPQTQGAGVQALVRRWRREHPDDPAAQALAALRFVQDDIRYTGIEIGIGSHKPRAPEAVLRTRYGDCKDKVLLLVSLWRAQGLKAWPALVSSWERGQVEDDLPSPLAFDHVIARLDWHGQRWLDATADLQGGSLADTAQGHFGRALVVGDGSHGLSAMPDPLPAAPTIDVEETLNLRDARGQRADTGALVIRTVYRGVEADDMRRTLARNSRETVAKHYLNYLAGYFPGAQAAASLTVSDDRVANVLRTVEHYRITDVWKPQQTGHGGRRGEFWLSVLGGYTQLPRSPHRAAPYATGRYRYVRERLQVRLDDGWTPFSDRTDVHDAWLDMHGRAHLGPGALTVEASYRSLARSVPAADMAAFERDLRQARDGLAYSLSVHRTASAGASFWQRFLVGLGRASSSDARWSWVLGGLVVLLAGVLALRRYRGTQPLLAVWWRPREAEQALRAGYGDGWSFLLLALAALAVRLFPDDGHQALMHMPALMIGLLMVLGAALTAGLQMLMCGPFAWFARRFGASLSWRETRQLAAWSSVPTLLVLALIGLLFGLYGREALVMAQVANSQLVSVMLVALATVALGAWQVVLFLRMMAARGGIRVRRAVAIGLGYLLTVAALVALLVLPLILLRH